MKWAYELFMFVTSFCIPIYHSINALKTQNNYLTRIWLFYFAVLTLYSLFLSFFVEPILNLIDPRLKHIKILIILLFIFPGTGLQESCSNLIDSYITPPVTHIGLSSNGTSRKVSDSLEETTSGQHSPTPSIPEEGRIKKLIIRGLLNSESSTLVPNTPTNNNEILS